MTARMDGAALVAKLESGEIIRRSFRQRDTDGRMRFDLLSTMVPEVERAANVGACPPETMPRWLAYLIPALQDGASNGAHAGIVRSIAAAASIWHTVPDARWPLIEWGVRAAIANDVMAETPRVGVGILAAEIKNACVAEREGVRIAARLWLDMRRRGHDAAAAASLESWCAGGAALWALCRPLDQDPAATAAALSWTIEHRVQQLDRAGIEIPPEAPNRVVRAASEALWEGILSNR